MKEIFKELLFNHHILVSDSNDMVSAEDSFCTLIALANRFGIRITEGATYAAPDMVETAATYLGEYVPEPFYRGFPESVRRLTSEQRLFDQLYHYTQTYGNGWFDEVGHSVNEEIFGRLAFAENTEAKDFVILPEKEAMEKVKGYLIDLMKSSRPLNPSQNDYVWNGYMTFGKDILPDVIPCKRTVIELLYKSREMDLVKHLKLSDVIKLVEYIQYTFYGKDKLNKLNFCNQHRKLVRDVLDKMFSNMRPGQIDIRTVYEKRKTWCGLLHHIHYSPKTAWAKEFVKGIMSNDNPNCSVYSEFEAAMKVDRGRAAKVLAESKGQGALMRNLNYILSRCRNEHEMEEVFACLK